MKISKREVCDMYDSMLNESYPIIRIGYSKFDPSEVLKEMDPIAYRVGFNDFCFELESNNYEIEEE